MRRFVIAPCVVYDSPMLYSLRTLAILAVMSPAIATADVSEEFVKQVRDALPAHPGACVMAIDRGEVVFEHAYGLADVKTKTPCTPATNFRMASVSKQFTATAVLLLVDRGKLALDDTLAKFFPGSPAYWQKITVKHLLTHASGLPAYEELIPAGTTLQLDDLNVLHILMDTKTPNFLPGAKFEYSNSGYAMLGLIVEVAAEKPFHEFMFDDVLKPLGMSDSVLYQRGLNEVAHRAFGHERKDNAWQQADQSLTSAIRGDGAIYTSLGDYRKWLTGIEQKKLLTAASYQAMFTPHVLTDRNSAHYGYGWFIDSYRDEPRIYHNGDTRGFRLTAHRFPERRAALLVQLNGEVDGDTEQMTRLGERLADILIFDREQ
jgi:CubicO group peptidase (beta-lactamase class C family)